MGFHRTAAHEATLWYLQATNSKEQARKAEDDFLGMVYILP